jgi:hypothetical protein
MEQTNIVGSENETLRHIQLPKLINIIRIGLQKSNGSEKIVQRWLIFLKNNMC